MPNVDIHFNTSAELAGARAVQQNLERQIGQAKALGKDYSHLEAQLAKVNTRLKSSGQTGGFKDLIAQVPGLERFSGVLGSLGAKLGAGAAAAGAFVLGLKRSVQEFAAAEEIVASLDQALAQNSLLTDENRERYQALASELQRVTGIADNEWLKTLARLTQYGSTPETVGVDIEAVKNLAGLFEGNLRRATDAYARALQGQFEQFTEVGLVIDTTASLTEKLASLQEQAAQRGGGQLEARTRSLAGQYRVLKNNISDVFEASGRQVAQTGLLQAALGIVGDAMEFWAETLGGTVPQLEGLTNAVDDNTDSLLSNKEAAQRMADGIKQITSDATEATAAVSGLQSQIDDYFNSVRKVEELRHRGDVSALELRRDRGEISEEEFVRMRADMERRFEREQRAREADQLNRKIQLNEFIIQQRMEESRELEQQIEKEEALLKTAKEREPIIVEIAKAQQQILAAESDIANLKLQTQFNPLRAAITSPVVDRVMQSDARDLIQGKEEEVATLRRFLESLRERQEREGAFPIPGASVAGQTQKLELLRSQQQALDAANAPIITQAFSQNQRLSREQEVLRVEGQVGSAIAGNTLEGNLINLAEKRREEEQRRFEQYASELKSSTPASSFDRYHRSMMEHLRTLERRVDEATREAVIANRRAESLQNQVRDSFNR